MLITPTMTPLWSNCPAAALILPLLLVGGALDDPVLLLLALVLGIGTPHPVGWPEYVPSARQNTPEGSVAGLMLNGSEHWKTHCWSTNVVPVEEHRSPSSFSALLAITMGGQVAFATQPEKPELGDALYTPPAAKHVTVAGLMEEPASTMYPGAHVTLAVVFAATPALSPCTEYPSCDTWKAAAQLVNGAMVHTLALPNVGVQSGVQVQVGVYWNPCLEHVPWPLQLGHGSA